MDIRAPQWNKFSTPVDILSSGYRMTLVSSFLLWLDSVVKILKQLRSYVAFNGTLSLSYGVSIAIYDHKVLPVTQHKLTHPTLTLARQASTRFTYHGWMEC